VDKLKRSLGAGRAVNFLVGAGGPQQLQMQSRPDGRFPKQFGLFVIGRGLPMQFRSMALWEFYGSTHHPAGVIRPPRKRGQTGDQVASFLAETKIFADEGDRKPLCICSCL
jgi:hypothetical protein